MFGLKKKTQKSNCPYSVDEIKSMWEAERRNFKTKSFQETIIQSAFLGVAGNVADAYKENVWVFSAIRKIGNAIARVPLRFRELSKNIDDPPKNITKRNNPWIVLFNNPSPLMEKNQLWKSTLVHYESYGECFWVLLKEDGYTPISRKGEVPGVIEVAPRGSITPRYLDETKSRLVGWYYKINQTSRELTMDQCLRFFEYNPESILKSLSPSQVANLSISVNHKAHLYNDKFFKNGAQIAGYLIDKNPDSELTDEEAEAIRERWDSNHAGISAAHKTPILTNGLEFVATGVGQKDMDFGGLQSMLRDEIIAAHGVPKNKLGIYDGLSFANSKQASKDFYLDILIPKMDYFASVINQKMLGNSNVEAYFDYSQIEALKEERDTKISGAVQLYNMGYGLNQINIAQDLGMPHIDEDWANQAEDTRTSGTIPNPEGRPEGQDPSGSNSNQDASNQREGRNGKALLSIIQTKKEEDDVEEA